MSPSPNVVTAILGSQVSVIYTRRSAQRADRTCSHRRCQLVTSGCVGTRPVEPHMLARSPYAIPLESEALRLVSR
jgi:hypothetical protein